MTRWQQDDFCSRALRKHSRVSTEMQCNHTDDPSTPRPFFCKDIAQMASLLLLSERGSGEAREFSFGSLGYNGLAAFVPEESEDSISRGGEVGRKVRLKSFRCGDRLLFPHGERLRLRVFRD